MASALMAFVQGLGAEKENIESQNESKPSPVRDVDDVDEAGEDMFDDSDDEREPPRKAATLMDVAKQEAEASPSLMQVARTLNPQQSPKPTLASLAAEMNQEEHDRKSTKVQRALDTASSEVRAERAAYRAEQVASGLKSAVAEQQQQYEDDEFEDDAASVKAAAETLAASVAKAKSTGQRSPNRSRAKAPRKGQANSNQYNSKLEKQRAMQDKLSAFQLQQLSITQRRLFLASLAHTDENHNAKPKKRVANREALNELAKDKFTRQRQQQTSRNEFARLDDTRNCRFIPKLHSSSSKKQLSNDSDDEEGPGGSRGAALRRNGDFIRRMEASERARREQLRRTREEAAHLARVDKKECPSCGNPQSYSELTQKRKKCPNCGVTYKSRIAWSNVADEFLTRMEEFQQNCQERRREQQEEHERRETEACGSASPCNSKRTWEEVRDEFLGRVQLDLQYREMSRAAIWEEIQHQFSFSPRISRRAQQLNLGDFDDRVRRDLDERRLRREQLEARMDATQAQERAFSRRPVSSRAKRMTPASSFQVRLREDLAKRRAREQRW